MLSDRVFLCNPEWAQTSEFPSAGGGLGCVTMHRTGWSESLCFSLLNNLVSHASSWYSVGGLHHPKDLRHSKSQESPNDEEISEVLPVKHGEMRVVNIDLGPCLLFLLRYCCCLSKQVTQRSSLTVGEQVMVRLSFVSMCEAQP